MCTAQKIDNFSLRPKCLVPKMVVPTFGDKEHSFVCTAANSVQYITLNSHSYIRYCLVVVAIWELFRSLLDFMKYDMFYDSFIFSGMEG